MNKTKIILTIDASMANKDAIKSLIINGADVIRIDMNQVDGDFCRDAINKINEVNAELKTYVAIMIDLKGPSIRIGKLINNQAFLKKNDKIRIYMNPIVGDMTKFSIDHNIINSVNIGNIIRLSSGNVELKISEKGLNYLVCEVLKEGYITENTTINVLNVSSRKEFLSDEDRNIIKFAHEANVDFLGLSFISNHFDVLDVNDILINLKNEHIQIVSKIETSEAIDDIDNIIKLSDAIMINRKNLGMEVSAERIPGIQKKIISKCHDAEVISIVSSETNTDGPTRAEVSDIANAVLDGVDAFSLSSNSNALENLKNIERIIKVAEKDINYDYISMKNNQIEINDTTTSVAYSVASSADKLNCSAIFAPTMSGYTAKKISRFRPICPIIAISPSIDTVKSLTLNFGVYPILISDLKNLDAIIEKSKLLAEHFLLLESGDKIIITGGYPFKKVKHTNFMKIEEI